jgi:hypothetical protein
MHSSGHWSSHWPQPMHLRVLMLDIPFTIEIA